MPAGLAWITTLIPTDIKNDRWYKGLFRRAAGMLIWPGGCNPAISTYILELPV